MSENPIDFLLNFVTVNREAILIVLLAGIGLFFLLLAIIVGAKRHKKVSLDREEQKPFLVSMYDALFHANPEVQAQKFHVNLAKYNQDCAIVGVKPDLKSVCMEKMLGIILIVLGFAVFLCIQQYPVLLLVFLGAVLYLMPEKNLASKATEKKEQLIKEMPRFLDILETALQTGMPVNTALQKTASNLDGVLSNEIAKAFVDVQVGAETWQGALFKLATAYNEESFSEFVMALTTAYEKGVPILDTVHSESKRLKMEKMLSAKDKASKTSNTIVFPVMICEILPLLALLLLPFVAMLSANNIV